VRRGEYEDATVADAGGKLTVGGVMTVADLGRVVGHITHPRSRWLEQGLPSPKANFGLIARAADVSHAPNGGERRGGNAAQRPRPTDNTCKTSENTYDHHTCDNLPPPIGLVLLDAAPWEQQGEGRTTEDSTRNLGDGEMSGTEMAGKEEALRRLSKMLGEHAALALV
jgi:hypothetical protein